MEQNRKLTNEENMMMHNFLRETETMLREAGSIDEEKLSNVKKFMEFVFVKSIDNQNHQ